MHASFQTSHRKCMRIRKETKYRYQCEKKIVYRNKFLKRIETNDGKLI